MTRRLRAIASLAVVAALLGAPVSAAACALWCPPGATGDAHPQAAVGSSDASECATAHHGETEADVTTTSASPAAPEAAVTPDQASCCGASGLAAVDATALDGLRGFRDGVAAVPPAWHPARLAMARPTRSLVVSRRPSGRAVPLSVLRI